MKKRKARRRNPSGRRVTKHRADIRDKARRRVAKRLITRMRSRSRGLSRKKYRPLFGSAVWAMACRAGTTDTLNELMRDAKPNRRRGSIADLDKCRNPRSAKPDGHAGFYPVESLKGQYVKRKSDSRKVYRVSSYDREYRRWRLDDTADMSRDVMVKTGTKLYAGFTY